MVSKLAPYRETKILIVDDQTFARNLTKTILRKADLINLFDASSAKDAEKLIKKHNIDLVMCDWEMPGGSGLDLLQQIRQDEDIKDTMFMMVTSNTQVDQVKEAIGSGVDGYVTKPFQPDTLYQKLFNLLEKKSKK